MRILGADFGCGFWCGFWVQIFGADFGADFSTGCADFGCGFFADFLQKAPSRRTVHFPKNPNKIHTKNPPPKPFRTPGEAFGRRLSAGRHAKRSEASSWVGALRLDKVAGLGCSSVPVLCLYYILCFKFCDSANETSQTAKRFEKIDLRDENPFRDFFLAKVWLKKLRCVGFIYSRIEVSEGSDIHVVSDENDSAWETLFVPSTSSHRDPNRAPTEVAPSTPVLKEGETPSIFETPRFDPDQGDPSPDERAIGVATKIESKERMAQTPPLVSRPIQGYLEHTGIEACPLHQMDHGVRDPDCHHCKRALGPLYHHKIKGNRHLLVFTFDFSGPRPVTG